MRLSQTPPFSLSIYSVISVMVADIFCFLTSSGATSLFFKRPGLSFFCCCCFTLLLLPSTQVKLFPRGTKHLPCCFQYIQTGTFFTFHIFVEGPHACNPTSLPVTVSLQCNSELFRFRFGFGRLNIARPAPSGCRAASVYGCLPIYRLSKPFFFIDGGFCLPLSSCTEVCWHGLSTQ